MSDVKIIQMSYYEFEKMSKEIEKLKKFRNDKIKFVIKHEYNYHFYERKFEHLDVSDDNVDIRFKEVYEEHESQKRIFKNKLEYRDRVISELQKEIKELKSKKRFWIF